MRRTRRTLCSRRGTDRDSKANPGASRDLQSQEANIPRPKLCMLSYRDECDDAVIGDRGCDCAGAANLTVLCHRLRWGKWQSRPEGEQLAVPALQRRKSPKLSWARSADTVSGAPCVR